MAKQAGDYFIEGTIDDLTFYKMCGDYYVRMKSSLTGKRFWKENAFERSRESCKRFGEGNMLASRLYRSIEKEKRQYSLFRFLKRRAILLLKEGKDLLQAEKVLMDYLMEFGFIDGSSEKLIPEKTEQVTSKDIKCEIRFEKKIVSNKCPSSLTMDKKQVEAAEGLALTVHGP